MSDSGRHLIASERPISDDLAESFFLSLLIMAPLSTLIGRLMIRIAPYEWLLQKVTSFPAARIASEHVRITSEGGDLLSFLLFLTIAIGIYVLLLYRKRSRKLHLVEPVTSNSRPRWSLVMLSIALLIHFGSFHKWRVYSFGDVFLDGFGLAQTSLVILCVFTLFQTRHLRVANSWFEEKFAQFVALILLAVVVTPFLLPLFRGVANVRNIQITLNELAAPTVGAQNLQDFFPTYTNLFGYIAEVLALPFDSPLAKLYALWTFFAMTNVLTLVLLFVLIWRTTHLAFVMSAMFVATVIAAQRTTVNAISILTDHSLGLRFFIPLLTLLLLVSMLRRDEYWFLKYVGLGILLGLALVNNFEFGLTFTLSVLCLLALASIEAKRFLWGFIVALALCATTTFALIGVMSNGELHSGVTAWRMFSSARLIGGYVNPTPIWGVHQFALAIYGVGIYLGLSRFLRTQTKSGREWRASSGLLMVSSVWGILSYPKYLGDNGPAFWSQNIVILSVTLVGVWNEIFAKSQAGSQCLGREKNGGRIRGQGLLEKSLAVFSVLCFLALPDPQLSIARYFDEARRSWTPEVFMKDPLVLAIQDEMALAENPTEIAYYGEYANLISLFTKATPAYGVHDPMIAYSTSRTAAATCKPLLVKPVKIVFASKQYLPKQFLEPDTDDVPCEGLKRDSSFDSELLIRYEFTPESIDK